MKKKYWHELTDEQVNEIIMAKRKFSWIMNRYKKPDWCNHANPVAPGAFGCEILMNDRAKINPTFCINCRFFKH